MELSQELSKARDSNAYWDHAVQVFSRNSKDVVSALFYSTDADTSSQDSTGTGGTIDSQYQCKLRRSIGSTDHPFASIDRLDLRDSHGVVKLFKKAVVSDLPLIVDLLEDPEAQNLAKSLHPEGSVDECRTAIICPLHPPSSKETILGFMVFGLSEQNQHASSLSC